MIAAKEVENGLSIWFLEVVEVFKARKESPFPMRRRKRDLAARVNGQLRIEFKPEHLTSFGGLELVDRYLRLIGFNNLLRNAFAKTPIHGDFSVVAMARLFIGLLLVGARRLRHVRFVSQDPMMRRFSQLAALPDERTLSRWLGRFDRDSLRSLDAVNRKVVFDDVRKLGLRTLTLDVDGTIVSTGLGVEWAQRGFNPHHRKVPSYYPAVVHLAETGQILGLKNRPGNVHDGVRSVGLVRQVIGRCREELGRDVKLRFRMDGAFFLRQVIEALDQEYVDFAVKVPMHRWLDLKPRIQMRMKWEHVTEGVSSFETVLPVPQWGRKLRVVCYRKRVFHETAKNYQLDLFSPNDGTFEYSAVATSLSVSAKDLWWFMAGRGAQEKTFAELKDGLAFATVPTRRYAANSAWQWFSVIAHNLHRGLQLSQTAALRGRTKKRTFLARFETIRTARFEWLNVAGRLLRLETGRTLRLASNPGVEARFKPWLHAA